MWTVAMLQTVELLIVVVQPDVMPMKMRIVVIFQVVGLLMNVVLLDAL